ncbi:MAG TPA: penicillin acylase family protein [Chitinophagaceae bacterium]|nr:penicillin acylase family protein [Chitinophagaceae bacterium]
MNRFIQFSISLVLVILWIVILNNPIGKTPALGPFFSPKTGFWSNAENKAGDDPLFLMPTDSLNDSISVIINERMIPHIIAADEADLYFTQGYLHAHFRLWQMDFYARLAGGTLSEVLGSRALSVDQEQRRKGMLWAAEAALKKMEKDPETKKALDQYTRGVNTYLSQLRFHHYPIEFKLLSYVPEKWTNLKSMLVYKLLSDDLTGQSNDIDYSYYRSILSPYDFEFLFPTYPQPNTPTINKKWDRPQSKIPNAPAAMVFSDFEIPKTKGPSPSPSLTTHFEDGLNNVGSNNWVVGTEKTMFDNVLLASDPHLQLSIPSIWFEMQLSSPYQNVYGVSLPGIPSIIIGYNDDISWGVTNHYADVKDYYEITPNDNWTSYSFDQEWVPFNYRIEKIKVRNEQDFLDTILYTIHGPVIYDHNFKEPSGSNKILAMKWEGHQTNNELKAFIKINKSKNFKSFQNALSYYGSPAQNFIYGDISGNIGIIEAGDFPNKFKNQGRFVMLGNTSATLWQEYIPTEDQPFSFNPESHFLSSANNTPVDRTYPYHLYGSYTDSRNRSIHQYLEDSTFLSVTNMKVIQNSNFSPIANDLGPLFQRTIDNMEDKNADIQHWSDAFLPVYDANSESITAFHIWHQLVYKTIWDQHFSHLPTKVRPGLERTIQLMLHYPKNKYFEFNQDGESINLNKIMEQCLVATADSMRILKREERHLWSAYKNTKISHLLSIDAFSYLNIPNGGWNTALNATTSTHGPSWRMVIDLNPHSGVKGYGIKPGGQSGNPGSPYFNYALDMWVKGEYYELPFMNGFKVKEILKRFKDNKESNE